MNALEHSDLDLRGIAIGAAAIALMIVLAVLAAWLAWDRWRPAATHDGPNAPLDFGIAGARLESAPFAERDAYFAAKQRELHAWGWVDRRAGIARIPIEESMRLLAVRSGRAGAGEQRP
jgi:hypothetical protein